MAELSFRDRVELKIRLTGRFVICVLDDEGGPSFTYTIGNIRHLIGAEPMPELLIIGTAEGQILCNKSFADPTQN